MHPIPRVALPEVPNRDHASRLVPLEDHAPRGEPRGVEHAEGEHVLKGDVVSFPRGKDGARQIITRTDSPVRVLMLS
jgi:hypothetical protein